MKGLLMKFADGLLSREQMKRVTGGYGTSCPDGVNYVTQQQCDLKCTGKVHKCTMNPSSSEYQCTCND
jgi:hypothetical protein